MARTTTTTYTCDGCGKETDRKGLRRFELSEKTLSGVYAVGDVTTDLCTECEVALHAAMKTLWPPDEFARIEGIVRP